MPGKSSPSGSIMEFGRGRGPDSEVQRSVESVAEAQWLRMPATVSTVCTCHLLRYMRITFKMEGHQRFLLCFCTYYCFLVWRLGACATYKLDSSPFQYIPGSVPIILSVPHGGLLEPADIPDRYRDPILKEVSQEMR